MTPADFLRIRTLYGETQEAFGRRLGWEGSRPSIERKVHRYEKGETPIIGTLAVLLATLEQLAQKPDTRRRS